MELVTVTPAFEIVIPASIRALAHVDVGDVLEARVENGVITFTPKSVVDRNVAEALADIATARAFGPWKSAREAIAAVRSRSMNSGPVESAPVPRRPWGLTKKRKRRI